MRLLAFDTATRQATVAVWIEGRVAASAERTVTTHSEGLLALVDEVLRKAGVRLQQCDALVCGTGPGSFTGLRIGLSTAKGLCLAAGKPLVCMPSLVALAMATRESNAALTLATLDAGRDEVCCQLFEAAEALAEEWVGPPDRVPSYAGLSRRQDQVLLVGGGAVRYEQRLRRALGKVLLARADQHEIRAGYLAEAAVEVVRAGQFDDVAAAVPRYARPPDIRPPRRGAPAGGGQVSSSARDKPKIP